MKGRYGSDDGRSLADSSAGGQTHGNMSYVSESGFDSATDDYNHKRKLESSVHHLGVAMREQKAVNRSKLLVSLFLFLAACATATVTFLYVEQQERNNFEDLVSDLLVKRWSFCPCCHIKRLIDCIYMASLLAVL